MRKRNEPAHTNVLYGMKTRLLLLMLVAPVMLAVMACTQTPGPRQTGSPAATSAPTNIATAAPSASARPPESTPTSPAAGRATVTVKLVAGPVCPVERNPPDPSCAARPVADTEVVVSNMAGAQVASGKSDFYGTITFVLPGGDYAAEAADVAGLIGRAPPQLFTVADGDTITVTLAYDTGIR